MQIKQLCLYPFKSLKGIEVAQCEIDERGFAHDRIYMLVNLRDTGATAITQRSDPVMALITQRIVGDQLVLSYLDQNNREIELELPLDTSKWPQDLDTVTLTLWDLELTGFDVGTDAIRDYFVNFFTTHNTKKYNVSNLTVLVSKTHRPVPGTQESTLLNRDVTSNFQDLFPGTLMTTASFTDLADHVSGLDEAAKIDMNSFRMNMLIETDEPWIEDDWQRIRIGDHQWTVLCHSERCSMPAVDQALGTIRRNRNPLPSLNRFRVLERGRAPCFGMCLANEDYDYTIKVGDVVEVLDSEL